MIKLNRIYLFPFLLVFYEFLMYLSNDAYLPALPQIGQDLLAPHHLVQMTITTWFLGACFMQLLLGPISDRYGRRPVLFIGGLFFIISTIACGISQNIEVLLFFRFIQGMSITSMQIAGYSTIHELFDQEKAIQTIAMMGSITVLAPALGPLIGSFILYFSDWRAIFFILGILAIVAVGALFVDMPETVKNKYEHPLNFIFVFKQYLRIILNPIFSLYSFAYCFLFCGMIAWIAASPFLVMTEFHQSAFVFGIVQALVFGSLILGTRLVKPIMQKFSVYRLMQMGIIIAFIGAICAFVFSIIYPNSFWLAVISMMLLTGGSGFSMPVFNRLIVEASNEPMGSRIATFTFYIDIFGMLGSFFISLVYNNTLFSFTRLLLILAILSMISYLLVFLIKRRGA